MLKWEKEICEVLSEQGLLNHDQILDFVVKNAKEKPPKYLFNKLDRLSKDGVITQSTKKPYVYSLNQSTNLNVEKKDEKKKSDCHISVKDSIGVGTKIALDGVKIDYIQTLKNFKDDLSSLYMRKPRIAFDLGVLAQETGLKLTDYNENGMASFQNHLEVKDLLRNYITDKNREAVCNWIVKKWGGIGDDGGIGKINPETIKNYSDIITKCNGNDAAILDAFIKVGGVASWSKILSFHYPQKYYVYGARVSFTLDFLLGENRFPVPSGLNSTIKPHIRHPKNLQPSLDQYKDYCELIRQIHYQLWPEEKERVYLTEMLLFSLLNDKKKKSDPDENHFVNLIPADFYLD